MAMKRGKTGGRAEANKKRGEGEKEQPLTGVKLPRLEPGSPSPYRCAVPYVPPPVYPVNVSPDRLRALLETEYKWVNGTVIHYYFFDKPSDFDYLYFSNGTREKRLWAGADAQKAVVRDAFIEWKKLGMGLEFREVATREEAEVRIGFMQDDGSWSHIGTYVLKIGQGQRTMNFGWDLTNGQTGMDTALHEIGHTLGLPHEHQNPFSGIVWDEEAVYTALAKPPNGWSRETTFQNIIQKLVQDRVQGSSWDPDSVMHYPFEAGLIKEPTDYKNGLKPGGSLSSRDRAWVRAFYPAQGTQPLPQLQPGQSQPLPAKTAEQQDFEVRPTATRYYNIRTFGSCDTLVTLFRDVNGDMQYRTADDDGGEDRNASLRVKLTKDQRYVLRVRVKFSDLASPPSVMMW